MRWDVEGADRTTGEDVNIFVEAATKEDAVRLAQARNVVVSSVELMPESTLHTGDSRAPREARTPKSREPKYEYKMVQVPPNIVVQAEEQQGQEAAHFLQALANKWAREGWEFYRVDTVGVVTPAGCLGALLGQPDRATSFLCRHLPP